MDAFRRLRSGYTVGKVVIRLHEMCDDISIAIITGGLALVTAQTFVNMGADHMVLVS